jgi:hypothetical protein
VLSVDGTGSGKLIMTLQRINQQYPRKCVKGEGC